MRNFLLIIFFLNLSLYSYDIKKTIIYNSEYSELSNNYSSWKSNSIQTILKNNDKTIGIKAENVEKYNLDDNNIELSYFTLFLDNFLWQIDLNMAENGVIIPKNIIYNKISYNIENLLGISYGLKNNKYKNNQKNQVQEIELEKYYGDFRFAFTKSFSDVKNAGSSTGYKYTTHYFYNNHFTALSFYKGKELEALISSVLISNVKSISLYGQYSLFDNWAIGYSTQYIEQDDLYIRKSISLAAIYRF